MRNNVAISTSQWRHYCFYRNIKVNVCIIQNILQLTVLNRHFLKEARLADNEGSVKEKKETFLKLHIIFAFVGKISICLYSEEKLSPSPFLKNIQYFPTSFMESNFQRLFLFKEKSWLKKKEKSTPQYFFYEENSWATVRPRISFQFQQ